MNKLEKIEELAVQVHGYGAAVSVDQTNKKEDGSWAIRVWDARGLMVEEFYGDTKAQAMGYIFELLRRKADDIEEEENDS